MAKMEADISDNSLSCDLVAVVPHTPPPARLGGGSREGGKVDTVLNKVGDNDFNNDGTLGDTAQGPIYLDYLDKGHLTARPGSECEDRDVDSYRVNKVVSSSNAVDGMRKGNTTNRNEGGGSTAGCKCVAKYRIMSKKRGCRGCGS